ncbi:Uncharacterised protein [Mycobacteroides abscessus]|nr:Uncharacterised protein [Mycobacteroides abscessus]CPU42981.1 Uncharacterised protein [Mycobacteroides abscessus]CPU60083.1 Uncharacterised protein [Mycobacteroides abscessus]CPV41551.1 Uncharacterised protein [Mycobacteroides abscessus]
MPRGSLAITRMNPKPPEMKRSRSSKRPVRKAHGYDT